MKVHFIGIGGIGVSALAGYYLAKGHKVSGSDLVSSEIINDLKKKGAKVFIGKHKTKNLPDRVDLVVFSPAIPKNNPELKKAYKIQNTGYKIQIMSYPQALGELTQKYWTVAVSGTHGKSTTTAMVGLVLAKAGLDPTVIVGTKLKEFGSFTPYRTGSGAGSNCRVGKSQFLVIEADEHMASFLNYWPKIIVLTNIEKEHLDFYKNIENVRRTYKEYLKHLALKTKKPAENSSPRAPLDEMSFGFSGVIANKDDKNVVRIIKEVQKTHPIEIKWYSLKQKEAKNIRKILKIPGEHNVSNALAVLATARALKIPDKTTFRALSEYRGSWRRFDTEQLTINNQQLTIISDYAHHPTEIRVTLKAIRERFPDKKIWVVFQPHQYQRTFYLFEDFIKVLGKAPVDKLIITDIYDVAGREEKRIKKKVNSEKLAKAIKKPWVVYLKKEKILSYLKKNLTKNSVLIIMGAGDIYKLPEQF